mgnify:CR=1 FL=1
MIDLIQKIYQQYHKGIKSLCMYEWMFNQKWKKPIDSRNTNLDDRVIKSRNRAKQLNICGTTAKRSMCCSLSRQHHASDKTWPKTPSGNKDVSRFGSLQAWSLSMPSNLESETGHNCYKRKNTKETKRISYVRLCRWAILRYINLVNIFSRVGCIYIFGVFREQGFRV